MGADRSDPDVVPALAMRARGDGSPVVFLHGLDDDSSCWEAVVEELAPELRCISVDLPGHGDSPTPATPDSYRRDNVLRALDRVLEQLPPAVLVGHSLGGYLGLAHVLSRPGKLQGLVLVGTGPGFRDEDSRRQWNERVLANAARYKVSESAATIALHEDSFVIDHLTEVDLPVALVVGGDDRGFLGANDYLERKLPRAERTTVDAAGHFVMRSHPHAVAEAIRQVVDRTL